MRTGVGERCIPSRRGGAGLLTCAIACAGLGLSACIDVAPPQPEASAPPDAPVLAGVYEGSGTGNDHVGAPPPRVTVESPLPCVLTFSWPACEDGTARLAKGDARPSDPYTVDVTLPCDSGFYFAGTARFQGAALDLALGLYQDVAFTTTWYGDASFEGVRVSPGP